MPRRSTGESPAPRRKSARIAAVEASKPVTSPAKKRTPKRLSKVPKKETVDDHQDLNGSCASQEEADIQPVEKKPKCDDVDEAISEPQESKEEQTTTVASEESKEKPASESIANCEPDVAKDCGFEVVNKEDVPSADSEAVKSAISAQGEDGQLLVNFVQVTQQDVPPATEPAPPVEENTNGAVPPVANGIDNSDVTAVPDAHTTEANNPAKGDEDSKPEAVAGEAIAVDAKPMENSTNECAPSSDAPQAASESATPAVLPE